MIGNLDEYCMSNLKLLVKLMKFYPMMKKERNMIPFDDFIYVNMFNNSMNMTVAMDIMIFSEKDQTIFALNSNRFMYDDNANILSMKIVGGKLEFSIFQKYIAKTNISLPKNKWINIFTARTSTAFRRALTNSAR